MKAGRPFVESRNGLSDFELTHFQKFISPFDFVGTFTTWLVYFVGYTRIQYLFIYVNGYTVTVPHVREIFRNALFSLVGAKCWHELDYWNNKQGPGPLKYCTDFVKFKTNLITNINISISSRCLF